MTLKYKTVSTFMPGEGNKGKQLWFPKLTGSEQVDLMGIAKILSMRSTASGADLSVIIMGLVDLIPELLLDGKTIKLDNFGTFRLHAKVNTSSSPEKVSSKNIKELHISFRPDRRIKDQLHSFKISKENEK